MEENVKIDEGVSRQGVRTEISFEGDEVIVKKSFDAEPHLRYAEQARAQTAGMGWGEGRVIGHIPPAFYAQICTIRDPQERDKAVMRFLRENPAFVMFDKALKV